MTAELGQPGQIIDGKYRIVRLLGTGGMGAVFEGENIRIRRRVAIKMLHGSVSSQPDTIRRFEQEAQAAALVGSDHICEVLDLGMLPDETRYMVMEYLEGETLSSLIKRNGRLRPPQSIPILLQILDALGAAHAAGIIHRDLKPDNVFILPQKGGVQSFVKILDFGVSKFSQLSGDSMNQTRAGAVVGTPYYMSPEQARGSSAIDHRTDVYAIGVLLYQATTGQVPYQAETFNELLFKIVLEVAPPPQTYVPDIDPAFAGIIQKAMSREPDQRFQSCQQFREALAQYQAQIQPRPLANPLPAFSLPGFHDGVGSPRTELLDPGKLPPRPSSPTGSGASWPAALPPGVEGTMPMLPGLPLGSNTGPGSAPSPLQSGAGWAAASSPSNAAMPVMGAAPESSTANSWGNASSPSNAQIKPRSNGGVIVGVLVAAVLAVGAAVAAFVVLGKGPARTPPPAVQAAQTSATVIAVTATSAPSTVSAPATATSPAPASSAEAPPAPAVGASDASSAKPALGARLPGSMPGAATAIKTGSGASKAPKTAPKSGGNDLGY